MRGRRWCLWKKGVLALGLMLNSLLIPPLHGQDTPEDKQSHSEDDPSPTTPVSRTLKPEEAPLKTDEPRGRAEGDEELPEEFQPDQIIPFNPSQIQLPAWQENELSEIRNRRRPSNQGGGLFPPLIWPIQAEPPWGPLPPREPSAPLHPAGDAAGEFLSPALAARYFDHRPDRALLDPQHLIEPARAKELDSLVRRWLNEQSGFRTVMLVFGPGQKLPEELDTHALIGKWFDGGENSLLLFYFYGQPERAKAVFSPGWSRRFQDEQLTAAMVAAIQEAGRAPGPVAQIERLCYKTAVRMARLAKSNPGHPAREARNPAPARAHRKWQPALALALIPFLVWILRRAKNRRSPEPPPVLLPEQDLHTRLGAPHCGGFSAVLTYTPPGRGRS